MIIAKTPWLREDGSDYVFGDESFCCEKEVAELFEIPEGSKIRFVVYNRPGNYRYKAHVTDDEWGLELHVNGKHHNWILDGLEEFLKQFKNGKTYYVECELK